MIFHSSKSDFKNAYLFSLRLHHDFINVIDYSRMFNSKLPNWNTNQTVSQNLSMTKLPPE